MANLLTAIRLLLIAPVCWGLASPGTLNAVLLLLLIAVAIATDYFDGKLARRLGTASARGMLFDHSTDFLFVTSSLASLAYAGLLPAILPALIVLAFSQYVIDSYWLYRQKSLRMSALGRWNGVFYFVPIVLLSAARLPLPFAVAELAEVAGQLIGTALVLSTLLSIIDRASAPWRQGAQ